MSADLPPYDAVVLAGGRARRLGGVDKPGLAVGGRPLVGGALSAVRTAGRVVLVGPAREGLEADVTVREDPPGSGPVAALAAGLAEVRAEVVAVLAGDLPFVTAADVDRLRAALDGSSALDAAVAVDADGRDQLLLAVWRTAALRRQVDATRPAEGAPVRRCYDGAEVTSVRLDSTEGGPPPWFDCDTPDDLHTAEGWT